MNILFTHNNFPAQFRHLYKWLSANTDFNLKFLALNGEWNLDIEASNLVKFTISRDSDGKLCHPNLKRFEKAVLTGQGCLRAAMRLNEDGFIPDLIIGHSGFGSTLYLKELWPKAMFLGYFEWFYKSQGSDVGFGKLEKTSPDMACRIHTYNAPILMDFALCDRAIVPTYWQQKQFPKKHQQFFDVIFDGIDINLFQPLKTDQLGMGITINGVKIDADIPLVTYTTRGFEPYRGWPQVAEGISLLMQRNPQIHVLLVGSDEVAYGSRRADGKTWRQWAFETFNYDEKRLHFLPPLSYEDYLRVLQFSWVHIYWTIPFIASWSLFESLSTGCCVVASNTDPVKEVITSSLNGILVDFFDVDGMAARVDEIIRDSEHRHFLKKAARQKIIESEYDLKTCLFKQLSIINEMTGESLKIN